MSKVLKRITFIALIMVSLSAVLLCGTLAKYVSELTGTGQGPIAKWSISAAGQTESFTKAFTAAELTNAAQNGTIAPGTSGEFTIELKNEGQVGATYEITVKAATGMPSTITGSVKDNGATGTLNSGATSTVTIQWAWAYEGSEEQNEADTALGKASDGTTAKDIISVTIKATQVAPSATV